MNLITLLTTKPPAVPVGAGIVHVCEDDEDGIFDAPEQIHCRTCNEDKPPTEFYRKAGRLNQYETQCKACKQVEKTARERAKK